MIGNIEYQQNEFYVDYISINFFKECDLNSN